MSRPSRGEKQQVELPDAPVFASVDAERQHRKERLAAAFRLFARFGFEDGVAGHITVRDPERVDHFWVNPFGMPFRRISVSDLILVDHRGEVVEGNRPVNRAAFAIHAPIHAARPDVIAAAHAHSIHGRAWSTLGRKLDPITQDACMFWNHHDVHNAFNGVVLDPEEGKRIAHCLGEGKALVLQNHGLLTVGQTVEEAVFWFVSMDRACHVQLLAEAAGKPVLLPPEVAEHTRTQNGTPWAGWFSAQPMFDDIVAEQPDLND